MGVTVHAETLSKEYFLSAVKEVLSNPKYTQNAERVKPILSDTPMKSKDLFLYWVNYTIRHKGALHLVSQAPFEMNVFQYWSVDVAAFLVMVPLLGIVMLVGIIKACVPSRSQKKKQD